MWRNEPCGESVAGSHFPSSLAPKKMERNELLQALVCNSTELALLMVKETGSAVHSVC